jgi:surface polysaccharide O-acyltransferase-like enzyme
MVKRLLILNGVAIVAAVLYHTTGWGFTALFWWTDRYLPVPVPNFEQLGGTVYYVLRFLEQLVIFAIPAFLFVSGYFVAVAAGRTQKTVNWKLIRSRIINLAIPFVLWSVLILAAKILEG